SVKAAWSLLERINIHNEPFISSLPVSQLHWIIADKNEAITVESVRDGIKVYDNPVGVLTNNPPFDRQMFNLNNYMSLSVKNPENTFSDKLPLSVYSRGMGALGLPGDLSSQSRFVRVAFVKMNSVSGDSEAESVSQFFHILGSVDQQRGCCDVGEGKFEITLYTSCCNADKGIYYYTTYNNHQITAVDMHRENLDGSSIVCYTPVTEEQISFQN
ncbi:MAG: linear amide C-N hydrolase, partial [Oscillospiraceae bacterium]|nr:linear amide C-N hydrolase [Oscillospiraceae bacterium]